MMGDGWNRFRSVRNVRRLVSNVENFGSATTELIRSILAKQILRTGQG